MQTTCACIIHPDGMDTFLAYELGKLIWLEKRAAMFNIVCLIPINFHYVKEK